MKSKKITVYELMGLIKDWKAPNKVKYENNIYEYDIATMDYFSENHEKSLLAYLFSDIIHPLYATVEIIEENDEWEEIHTIKFNKGKKIAIEDRNSIKKVFKLLCDNQEKLIIVMNKIIKNQKYLKERLDKDGKQ